MDNEKDILVDQAFRDGLESFESNFETADWIDMERRLASDDKMVVIPPVKRNFKLLILIIMISITTLTTALVLFTSTNEPVAITPEASVNALVENHITTVVPVENDTKEDSTSFIKSAAPVALTAGVQALNKVTDGVVSKISDLDKPEIELTENLTLNTVEELPEVLEDLSGVDTAKFLKKVVSRRWVDTTYRYRYEKPHKDVEQFWFGMYFTGQNMSDVDMWQSIDRRTETNGFNLQFMSGNVLPGENLAIYGGIDWGMQFYGRSAKDEVIINSVNEDRGVTFMRTHSNDLFATAHIEWTQFPVVPYLSGGLGTRILSTGQTTRTLVPSAEYESSQDNGVFTRAGLAYKAGFGVKVKLNPRIYLDTRYEYFQTDNLKAVDYTQSTYNGIEYDVVTKKVNMNSGQFRFGVVFDLSEEKYEKYMDKPGHWEEETQYLYVDPSDSSKVFVPCPCDKPQKSSKSSSSKTYSPSRSGGNDYPSNGGSNPINVPSNGGKSEFPGVKKPGKTW